jgi:coproporphyrinogen III oxidase
MEADYDHFKKFADRGLYTRHREEFVGYGFWLLPKSLRDQDISMVRYSILYGHGWRDAKKRIYAMAEGKVHPSKYGKLPLPKEMQHLTSSPSKRARR